MSVLQITFRNVEPSATVEDWIRDEVKKLETFYNQIISCRVVVDVPHSHQKKGSSYRIRIRLTLPGGEVAVERQADSGARVRQMRETKMRKSLEAKLPHKELRLAIDDAFRTAGRRLEDYSRRQRGSVKAHEPRSVAQVGKLDKKKGYGFLVAADGRQVYFHKESVLNRGFNRMRVGTKVSFAEEQGEKGPQASTVTLLRRVGSQASRVA